MRKNKLMSSVLAATLALSMTFSLADGINVKAAEMTEITEDTLTETEDTLTEAEDTLTEAEDTLTEAEDTLTETEDTLTEVEDTLAETGDANLGIDLADIKYQEPEETTELEVTGSDSLSKMSGSVAVDESNVEGIVVTQSAANVVAGTVTDYLLETGDAKIYNIDLPAGVYLQAQLTTPASAELDYDLYLLDSEGTILTGSEYYTYINGTSGTLPEAFGYITSGDVATYYLYVLSSSGGSVSEPFTLDFAISDTIDQFEIDEFASKALAFTYQTGGTYVEVRNLNSPVDNDWYKITVPSSRIYNALSITATTDSVNKCSVEVYQNISSSGYQMKRIGTGSYIPVSEGTYYIRVRHANSMEEFDETDIQNYRLTIIPKLNATGIVITDLKGSEGLNTVVNYPGFGAHFRTEGAGTLTVYGVVTAKDSTTGEVFAVSGERVDGLYYSPAWDNNNTPSKATREGHGTSDINGEFVVQINIPDAIGVYSYNSPVSTHYFDVCSVSVTPSSNTYINSKQTFFHLSYQSYHSF